MVNLPRILFVHNYPMRFVTTDLALLRDRYNVTECYVRSKRLNPFDVLASVHQSDVIFVWFASWHAVLPLLFARFLGKPSILIIGGYDVACMPEIDYGHQRGGVKQWVSRVAMHLATELITFSEYSQESAVRNVGLGAKNITVIYLGLDFSPFPLGEYKEPMVVTVGNVLWNNLARKGMEAFVRAAQYLPEVPFMLIGRWRDQDAVDYLRRIASSNVVLTGYISDEELVNYLKRAKVYVQASAHEGFGLSVAEAMLCGCIPVTTKVGALPEVVGDTGVYVPTREPQAVAKGIKTALALGDDCGRQARQHIVEKFPLANRREGLFEVVESVLAGDQ